MQVWVAIYVEPSDTSAWTRQTQALYSALQTYNIDNVAGITVGNECVLDLFLSLSTC
jgi:exo-beta-1,3-glucanase (GH17 family)